jgi:hypothetical protein
MQALQKKAARKSAKKSRKISNHDIESLLYHDFVASANANKDMPDLHVSNNKDKEKSLREIITKLRGSDQAEAKADKTRCIVASRKFKSSAKLLGNGWKINGLKTPLYHYQVSDFQSRMMLLLTIEVAYSCCLDGKCLHHA